MILKLISNTYDNISITDITTPFLALDISEISLSTVYWFTPYLASDFPTVTCIKTYFFLYSTDHDGAGGGIYWGVGNELDLSDFIEYGKIIDGYQAETPFLRDYPLETRRLRLYYHTNGTNPINSGIQETNLITTTGGLLHTATWTQESNPLGVVSTDDHTGYFKDWQMSDGTVKGLHFVEGSTIPILPVYNYSIMSSNGLTGTRDGNFYPTLNAPDDKFFAVTFGEFFYYIGRWWWIGTINSSLTGGETKVLGICKANGDLHITEVISILNGGIETYTWAFYISGNTAHCYLNDKSVGVWYATYDLKQLQNYV